MASLARYLSHSASACGGLRVPSLSYWKQLGYYEQDQLSTAPEAEKETDQQKHKKGSLGYFDYDENDQNVRRRKLW